MSSRASSQVGVGEGAVGAAGLGPVDAGRVAVHVEGEQALVAGEPGGDGVVLVGPQAG